MTLNWTDAPEDEETTDEHDVVLAVDAKANGGPRVIIADVTTDEAWIAAKLDDASTLTQWR